jgi:hypothetical protein
MIALLLVGFVLVATGVIARRVAGVRQQREITGPAAATRRVGCGSREARGSDPRCVERARLQPIAEQRLNMRIPKPDRRCYSTVRQKSRAHRMIRSSRIGLAHAALALFAIAIIVQAANVQLVQSKRWTNFAERQQTTERLFPRRAATSSTRAGVCSHRAAKPCDWRSRHVR